MFSRSIRVAFKRVLKDLADFETMPPDSEEEWAEASARLAGDVFGE